MKHYGKVIKLHFPIILLCFLSFLFFQVIPGYGDSSQIPSLSEIKLIQPTDVSGKDLSGDNSFDIVGKKLNNNLIVKAIDGKNNPIANVPLAISVVSQPENVGKGIQIEPNKGVTDKEGLFRVSVRLGDQPGTYKIMFLTETEKPAFIVYTVNANNPNWSYFLLMGLAGGMAIFLYGMKIAAGGLQRAAGSRLRDILSNLTKTPIIGVLMGIIITFFTQSSSATTVMLVSFVKAKLINLMQSLGVIYGSAIGTTITVQLISFNIMQYSLLMIVVGYIMSTAEKKKNFKYAGEALLGFGLIFFGMEVMTDVVKPLSQYPHFKNLILILADRPFTLLIISAIFTAVIHGSAPTIGIVLVLARHNLISLDAAIPVIFGSNIGTCATAMYASIGFNQEAKRVAYAHLLFKIIGVIIFYPFFIRHNFAILCGLTSTDVSRQIANAHTLFNIINTIIFLPLTTLFAQLVYKLIPEAPFEKERAVKYLDLTVIETPAVALAQVTRELSRMSRFVEEMMRDIGIVLVKKDTELLERLKRRDDKVDALNIAITNYLTKLSQKNLAKDESERSIGLLFVVKDLESIGDIIDRDLIHMAEKMIDKNLNFSKEGQDELVSLHKKISENLSKAVLAITTYDAALASDVILQKDDVQRYGTRLHQKHISRLEMGLKESIDTSSIHLDVINLLLRINYHSYSIAKIVLSITKTEPTTTVADEESGI